MAIPLTLRTIKGSKLTFNELDSNFLALRNAIDTTSASDTFVTGGTYNPSTTSLDFDGNSGFNPFSVNVSGLVDTFVSGGTYNSTTGCVTFVTNSGTTFEVCGFLTGATETAEVVWTGGSAGNFSVAQITDTTTNATADYAVAINRNTLASGFASFAGGRNAVASGSYSIAYGVGASATTTSSHAFGQTTLASGVSSFAIGSSTTAEGSNSFTMGTETTASGSNTFAGGDESIVSGEESLIYSNQSLLTGDRSVLLGGRNLTGTTNDTVYVPYLNINNLGTGTSINNLGIDSNGFVVTGTTGAPSFTGNTSGDCINELWVSSISGCSPVNFGTEVVFNQNASMGSSAGDTGVALKFFHQDPGDESTIQTDADNLIIGGKAIKILSEDGVSLTISDVLQVAGGPTGMEFSPGVGQVFNFSAPTLTGSRSANFPDKSGTVAYTSDLSSVTGFTYSNNNFTISQSGGLSDLVSNISVMTGLTVNGQTTMSGNGQSVLTVIGSGSGSTTPLFTVQGDSGELFSITDSLVGELFTVNDISGLPILTVFDDDTVLMGNYQAPSLNTTVKLNPGTGVSNVYSLPVSAYTGAFFDYTVSNTTGARAGNIMSIFSGTSVEFTETSTTDIGSTSNIIFTMSSDGSNASLQVSAATTGWEVKTIVRSI